MKKIIFYNSLGSTIYQVKGLPDTDSDSLMAVGWLTKAKILKPCHQARKKAKVKH